MATLWYQQINTSKRFSVGTIKRQNGNEYVYTPGVASLAAGDFVQLSAATFTTARLLTTTPTTGLVGVAMSANTSTTNYGWVQTRGRFTTANVASATTIVGKALFATSTAGRCTTTPATEASVIGAFADGDAVLNVGAVQLNNPSYQGDIST